MFSLTHKEHKHHFKEYKQGCHMLLKKNVFLFLAKYNGRKYGKSVTHSKNLCQLRIFLTQYLVAKKKICQPLKCVQIKRLLSGGQFFLNKLKNTRIIMYLPPPSRLLLHPVLYLMGYAIFMFLLLDGFL